MPTIASSTVAIRDQNIPIVTLSLLMELSKEPSLLSFNAENFVLACSLRLKWKTVQKIVGHTCFLSK